MIGASCSSSSPVENICSGCKLQNLHYNNLSDYTDLLHCKDTVYVIGPKGVIISKLPTGNK